MTTGGVDGNDGRLVTGHDVRGRSKKKLGVHEESAKIISTSRGF